MDVVKSAVNLLVVLSVLVVVHEWGHFVFAKLCRMRVEDFSLFFGKRLVCLGVKNGTEYNIRSIPLGGFVKIAGMEPDDFASAAPIFRPIDGNTTEVKLLKGLNNQSFANVNFSKVRDDVRATVEEAVGPAATLRLQGKENLRALLMTTGLNVDEHRYVEAILAADGVGPDPDGYNQRPIWQRAIVIFAGPLFSILFGYVLICVMGFTVGLPNQDHLAVDQVLDNKPAARAGLRQGDRLVGINGVRVNGPDSDALLTPIRNSPKRPVKLMIEHDGHPVTLTMIPDAEEDTDPKTGKRTIVGKLGFVVGPAMEWRKLAPGEAVIQGSRFMSSYIGVTLRALFNRDVGDNVHGIIAIAGQIHQDSQEGPRRVLFTTCLLSVGIGVVNLFPIPILDGGHLMLLTIEFVRRRKLSSSEVYAAQMVGISIIGVLFVWVMYKDIVHLLPHGH